MSRLTIAGGYVYAEPADDDGGAQPGAVRPDQDRPAPLLLPARRVPRGDRLSTSWDPWLEVDVQIDADTVHPILAFDRVFVFWATVEAVAPDPAAGTVVTTDATGAHRAAPEQAPQPRQDLLLVLQPRKEWVPAQELGASGPQDGTLSEVTLSVRAPEPQPGGAGRRPWLRSRSPAPGP